MKAKNSNEGAFTVSIPEAGLSYTIHGVSMDSEGNPDFSSASLKDLLIINLMELQKIPTLPTETKREARRAFMYLHKLLTDFSVTEYKDKGKGLPKSIAYSIGIPPEFQRVVSIPEEDAHIVEQYQKLDHLFWSGQATEQQIKERDELIEKYTIEVKEGEHAEAQKAHFESLVNELFGTEAVTLAIRITLLKFHDREPDSEADRRLFPESKKIDPKKAFIMPKIVSDAVNKGMNNFSIASAIEQYTNSAAHNTSRVPAYKIKGKKTGTETEFILDKAQLDINTAEQFANQLNKINDAIVLQTFCALWKWVQLQDSAVFRDVPISDIMALRLKASGDYKFNTAARKEFSEMLKFWSSLSMNVSYQVQEKLKSGKTKHLLREEKDVRFFRMVADYSLKKEHNGIPKEELDKDLHYDKSVIVKFSGELLPGHSHLLGERGGVYLDSLLAMDANKDGKAFIMGWRLQTRFNQVPDKSKPIEVDRASLVEMCEYQKTDKTKPSQATLQIRNNLEKLIKSGVIKSYKGLTNVDSDRVLIYPPKQLPGLIAS